MSRNSGCLFCPHPEGQALVAQTFKSRHAFSYDVPYYSTATGRSLAMASDGPVFTIRGARSLGALVAFVGASQSAGTDLCELPTQSGSSVHMRRAEVEAIVENDVPAR